MLLVNPPVPEPVGSACAVVVDVEKTEFRLDAVSARKLFLFEGHRRFPSRFPGPDWAVTTRLIWSRWACSPRRFRSIGPRTSVRMVQTFEVCCCETTAGAVNGTTAPVGRVTRPLPNSRPLLTLKLSMLTGPVRL